MASGHIPSPSADTGFSRGSPCHILRRSPHPSAMIWLFKGGEVTFTELRARVRGFDFLDLTSVKPAACGKERNPIGDEM